MRFRPWLNILGNITSPFTRDVRRQSGAVLKVVPTPPLGSSWADAVIAAVDGSVAVVAVPHVHWCDGSDAEWDALTTELVAAGTMDRLDPAKRPNSFIARSDPKDVARVESRTFICSNQEIDAGPTNNWVAPAAMSCTTSDL